MRVKCINDKWKASPGCEEAPRPVFNQDYNVDYVAILNGTESFILIELGDEYGYRTEFFAILPDNTADEMAEESREAIINLETVLV